MNKTHLLILTTVWLICFSKDTEASSIYDSDERITSLYGEKIDAAAEAYERKYEASIHSKRIDKKLRRTFEVLRKESKVNTSAREGYGPEKDKASPSRM
jgi:hypothetical protein